MASPLMHHHAIAQTQEDLLGFGDSGSSRACKLMAILLVADEKDMMLSTCPEHK